MNIKNVKDNGTKNGIRYLEVKKWSAFPEIVQNFFMGSVSWLFRGHRKSDWLLEPSLPRILRDVGIIETEAFRAKHLKQFEFAARGLRQQLAPYEKKPEDDPILYDWALGQHYGLATPLLDWTLYPYVAAFFAFESPKPSSTQMRTVWALHALPIQGLTKSILRQKQPWTAVRQLKLIRFFRPKTGENSRLIRQNGLFTITPPGLTVEQYVEEAFNGGRETQILVRMDFPEEERAQCLRELNRMSVNHLSLFPDLFGSGAYCNLTATIEGYRL